MRSSRPGAFGLKIKYLFANINLPALFIKTSNEHHAKNFSYQNFGVKKLLKRRKLIGDAKACEMPIASTIETKQANAARASGERRERTVETPAQWRAPTYRWVGGEYLAEKASRVWLA